MVDSVSKPPPDSRSRVGRFVVTSVLGAGAFGTVYLGRDPSTGSSVAVKVMDREYQDSTMFRTALRAEAAALRRIRDQHCVRVVDIVDEPDVIAIVTELVDGASLRAVLARAGRLTGPQSLDVLRGALLGLSAVHAAGLVHGDIKPDNILVDRRGVSKLIDFGLARDPAQRPSDGSVTGSPAYMSPEQITEGRIEARSDLYACAAVLFELLTGRRPFQSDRVLETLRLQVQAPVPDPRDLAPEVGLGLGQLCLKCLAKDPADRYATATEFLAALEGAARDRYGPAWHAGLGLGALAGAATSSVLTAVFADRAGLPVDAVSSGAAARSAAETMPRGGRRPGWRTSRGARIAAAAAVGAAVTTVIVVTAHRSPATLTIGSGPNAKRPGATHQISTAISSNAVGTTANRTSITALNPATSTGVPATSASFTSAPPTAATGASPPPAATRAFAVPPASATLPPLNSISCPTDTFCAATGHAGSTGYLLLSTDGGQTWRTTRARTDLTPVSITCIDAAHCRATAANADGGQHVITTDNGGRDWQVQDLPAGTPPLNAIACPDITHCWAVGGVRPFNQGQRWVPGAIVASADQGRTWRIQMPAKPGGAPLESVRCLDVSRCVAVGDDIVVTTSDGGAHWLPASTPTSRFKPTGCPPGSSRCFGPGESLLTDVALQPDGTALAVGGFPCGGVRITQCPAVEQAGTDHWTHWDETTTPSDVPFLVSISCRPGGACTAAGDTFTAGVIATTHDGRHWQISQHLPGPVTSMSCPHPNHCVAVGSLDAHGLVLRQAP